MPTYLLTIAETRQTDLGIRLSPGIRFSETADRPAIREMIQGSALELRSPEGTRHRTILVTYGVEVQRGDDGTLYLHDDPKNPEIKLTLPSDLSPQQCQAGTEVWLLERDGP